MATTTFRPNQRLVLFGQRLMQMGRSLFAAGDFTALLLAVALLTMPVLALEAAGWLIDIRTVLPVALLSIVFGFLLARSHYNELLCLIISAIYGMCFTLMIAAINQSGNFGTAVVNIFVRLSQWLYDAATGGINQDELVFTLLIASLFWFLGFNVAWHIFRIDRVWRAAIPPALILITNNIYYPGENRLDIYLIGFLFITLLLLVRSTLDAREWDWYIHQVRVPKQLRQPFYRLGALFALIALSLAWIIPQNDIEERLDRFQQFMQTDALVQISELWNRLFASVDIQGGTTTSDYYGGDSLNLGGSIRLGDQVVMLVSAPPSRRYYWRSRVFDTYDNGRWSSSLSAADTRLTDPESPLVIEHESYLEGARVPVQQTFTLALNASQIIYTAPQPLSVNLPTRTDLRYTLDQNLVDQNMSVTVIRPLQVLYRGESYNATSLMSSATPAQLRAAGENYPAWVRDTYTTYMPSLTGRTIGLANDIVRLTNATTPYDKAAAIETWLRDNITYNELIPAPPMGRDPVDWVLFDTQEGYCNYYASAMVTMLRSLGIPARIAAGFAQGDFDEIQGAYVVREKDAHTWVEVYFPGYGWVEFEPTSSESQIGRGEPNASTPPPTLLPTQTPPPTLTPTPTATFTTVPPQGASPEPTQFLLTPTLMPTTTPRPLIVPTQAPPLPPMPSNNPLSSILPIIVGVALLLLVVALLVLIGVFLYWWWEWRGMRGLSPIARAYARLERYVKLLGVRINNLQTPDERRARIVKALPRAAQPVTTITGMYVSERYSSRRRSKDRTPRGVAADKAWIEARTTIVGRFFARLLLPWRK